MRSLDSIMLCAVRLPLTVEIKLEDRLGLQSAELLETARPFLSLENLAE